MSAASNIFMLALTCMATGVLSKTKPLHVAELFGKADSVSIKSCGEPTDMVQPKSVTWDPLTMTAVLRGRLSQEVTGGKVSAIFDVVGTPPGSTSIQRVKHMGMKLAWLTSHRKNKKVSEDLCRHFSRGAKLNGTKIDCPLAAGDHVLRFSFDKMPRTVMAGRTMVKARALDQNGKQMACIEGSVMVPYGEENEIVRVLKNDGETTEVSSGICYYGFDSSGSPSDSEKCNCCDPNCGDVPTYGCGQNSVGQELQCCSCCGFVSSSVTVSSSAVWAIVLAGIAFIKP